MSKTTDKTWYVQAEPENRGPFSEEELRQQRLTGEIADDTPVWNFGMYEWEPLSKACPTACAGTRPPPRPPPAKTPPASPAKLAIPVAPEPLTMESLDLSKSAEANPLPAANAATGKTPPSATPDQPAEPDHAESLIHYAWESLQTYPIEGGLGWALWMLVCVGMYQTLLGGTRWGGLVFLIVLAGAILPLIMCGISRFAARWHLDQHPGQLELLAPLLFVKRWKSLATLTGISFVPTLAIHLLSVLVSYCGDSASLFIEERHFMIFLAEYGVLLAIIGRFYPAYLLVIDQGLEPRAAYEECLKMTRAPAGQATATFLMTLICINLVGLLPLGIGLVISLPVTMIAATLHYFHSCGIAADLAKPPPGMDVHH